MANSIIAALLIVIGVIHLLPLSGTVSAAALEKLYGMKVVGSDMEILLRHRAVLFGIFGGLFIYAAFTPAVQPLAFVIALFSIVSFLALAMRVGGYNRKIRKLVIADVVALVCLIAAALLYYLA